MDQKNFGTKNISKCSAIQTYSNDYLVFAKLCLPVRPAQVRLTAPMGSPKNPYYSCLGKIWKYHPLRTIANFCSLPLLSFRQALGKLQGKVVTHSEEVGWVRTLMVECVTLFFAI